MLQGMQMPGGLDPTVAAAMGIPAGLNLGTPVGTPGQWMPSMAPAMLRMMMPSADDVLKGSPAPLGAQPGVDRFGACSQPQSRFIFRPRTGRINWRLLHSLDLDRVVREGDIETLQAHMDNITYSRFSREDMEVTSDECIIKVVQLSQLCLEFLCSVCGSSQQLMQGLVEKVRVQSAQLKAWEARGGPRRSSTTHRAPRRRSKSSDRDKRELHVAGQGGSRKCLYCPKRFQSDQYLHEHMLRRHSAEMFAAQQLGQAQVVTQAHCEKVPPPPPMQSEAPMQCQQPEPSPSCGPPPALLQRAAEPALKPEASASEEMAKALRSATAGLQEQLRAGLQEQLQSVQHTFSDQLMAMRQDMGKVASDVNRVAEDVVKIQQAPPVVQQALPPPAPPLPAAEVVSVDADAIERRLETRVSDRLESSQKMLLDRIEKAEAAQRNATVAGAGAGPDADAQAAMQQELRKLQQELQQLQQFKQDVKAQFEAGAAPVRDAAQAAAAAAAQEAATSAAGPAAPGGNAGRAPSPDPSSTPLVAPTASMGSSATARATQDPAVAPSGRASVRSQQQPEPTSQPQQQRPSQAQPQPQPQQQPQPQPQSQQQSQQQLQAQPQPQVQAPAPSHSPTESVALGSIGSLEAAEAATLGGPDQEALDIIGNASPGFSTILESGLSVLQTEEDRLRFTIAMTQERTRPVSHGAHPTELDSQWTRTLQPDDAALGLIDPAAAQAGARCPNGHEVLPSELPKIWRCDSCGKAAGKQPGCAPCRRSQPPKVPHLRCEACNYDLCGACVEKAKQVPQSAAVAGAPGAPGAAGAAGAAGVATAGAAASQGAPAPAPGAGAAEAQQLALAPPEQEALDIAGSASPGFNELLEKSLSALQTEEEKLRFVIAMTQERTRPVSHSHPATELEQQWSRTLNPQDAELGQVEVPAPEVHVCCPNRHELSLSNLTKEWHCDSCSRRSKDFKKMQRFRCNTCNFDLCDECHAKEKKALQRSMGEESSSEASGSGEKKAAAEGAPPKEEHSKLSKESSGFRRALSALSRSRTSETSDKEQQKKPLKEDSKKKKAGISCLGRSRRKDASGDPNSSAAKKAASGIDSSTEEEQGAPSASGMKSLPDVPAASASEQVPPPPPPPTGSQTAADLEVVQAQHASSSSESSAGGNDRPPPPPPTLPPSQGPGPGPEASILSSRPLQPGGGFGLGPGPIGDVSRASQHGMSGVEEIPQAAEVSPVVVGGHGPSVAMGGGAVAAAAAGAAGAATGGFVGGLSGDVSMLDVGGPAQMQMQSMNASSVHNVGGLSQRSPNEVAQLRAAQMSGQVDTVEAFHPGNDVSAVSMNSDRTNGPRRNPDTQVQQFNMSPISDDESDVPRLPVAQRSGVGSERLGAAQATAVQEMSPVSDSDAAPTPIRGFGDAREEVTEVSSFHSTGVRPQTVRPAAAQQQPQQQRVEHTAVRDLCVDSASEDDDVGPVGGWTGVGVRRMGNQPAGGPAPSGNVRGFNEDTSPLDNSGVKAFSPASVSSSGSRALREPVARQGSTMQAPRERSISQLMEESL